jgi:ribosome-binding ATPase YchF (GTP1/OBG family)
MNAETRIVATEPPMVALVGNPNAGKSALFNALTGARQKVGNYPGVTVERHAGRPTKRSRATRCSASRQASGCLRCWSWWSMRPTSTIICVSRWS